MTDEEVNELPCGVYRLSWDTGGCSLAAVGRNSKGEAWFAPCNWVTVPSRDWAIVARAELICRNFPDSLG